MKTFKVFAEITTLMEIDIEAKNAEQAELKASKIDPNEWSSVEDTNFDIVDVEEYDD